MSQERYRHIPDVQPTNPKIRWVDERIADIFLDINIYRDVSGWNNLEEALKFQADEHRALIAVGKHNAHIDPWGYLKPLKDRAQAERRAGNEKGALPFEDLYNNTVFLIGDRIARLPVIGQLIKGGPGIYIPSPKERPRTREELKAAREKKERAENAQREVLTADRVTLFLYPEGTRSRTGGMNHPPAMVVSTFTLVDGTLVLPVIVQGTEKVNPIGSPILRRGRVTVEFGEIIDVSELQSVKKRREQFAYFERVIMKEGIAYRVAEKYRGVYAREV